MDCKADGKPEEKAGGGVNVQTHLVAMHHVDCPWKPSSIEQREGRGITDKNGLKHIYEVTETEVVNPCDNSIKTQGDEKELTLFTCSQKGTMRFVRSLG